MMHALRTLHRGFFRRLGFGTREARLLTWGGGCLAVAGWADVSLQNAAETLFLKRVGVVYLPWALLASAILLAVSTYVTAHIIARRDRLKLLPWAFITLAGGLVALWLLLHLDLPWVFGALILFSKQFKTVALLVFWTTIGDLLDGRQAKRLYAPLTAGLTVGTIAGSFASEPIGHIFGIEGLVYIAAAVLAAGTFFALPLRRASLLGFDERESASRRPAAVLPDRAAVSPVPLWRESRLFRVLLLATIFAGVLGPILFYQFSYAADLATQGAGGEQELLTLYARMRGWLNLGVLVLQLTITPRLYGRVGLPAALLLSPLTYLGGFLGLAVHPSLAVNIGAVAATRLQGEAVYEPAVRILSNLFPERMRARVTALLEGPVSRTGAVAGNVIVLVALAVSPQFSGIYAALVVAVLWLAVSFTLWREYPSLLLEALARPDSLGGGQSLSALLNPSTVKILSSYLSDANEEKCRMALDLLCKAPPATAIEALALAAGTAPTHTRRLLLDALMRACDNPERPANPCPRASSALAALLEEAQTLPADERLLATQAYGMLLGGTLSAADRVLLGHLQRDREAGVRLAAETALSINGVAVNGELDQAIEAELESPSSGHRRTAISELRRLLLRRPIDALWNERISVLTRVLEKSDDRPVAARALADIALRHSTAVERVQADVVRWRNDANPATRSAVLRFIGRARLYDRFPCLLSRLTSDDPDEAAAARDGMLGLGDRVVDELMAEFRCGAPKLRRAILLVLHQLGLDANDARTLIDDEVEGIQKAAVALSVLAPLPDTPALLVQRLEERISEALHTLAIILTARFNSGGIGEVDSAIREARGARQRAILLEAVERSMTPREAAKLLPLLEGTFLSGRERKARGHSLPTPREAVHLLEDDRDALTRTLAGLAVATLDAPGGMLDDDSVANLVELALQIKSIPIFERLSVEQLLDLAKLLREEVHPPKTVIVREGQCGTGMYVILEGEVQVLHGEEEVAVLGERDFFGEMAVLDGEARSATVRAARRVRLLRLERADLLALMEENSAIGIAVAQSLAQRLRLRLEKETLQG